MSPRVRKCRRVSLFIAVRRRVSCACQMCHGVLSLSLAVRCLSLCVIERLVFVTVCHYVSSSVLCFSDVSLSDSAHTGFSSPPSRQVDADKA